MRRPAIFPAALNSSGRRRGTVARGGRRRRPALPCVALNWSDSERRGCGRRHAPHELPPRPAPSFPRRLHREARPPVRLSVLRDLLAVLGACLLAVLRDLLPSPCMLACLLCLVPDLLALLACCAGCPPCLLCSLCCARDLLAGPAFLACLLLRRAVPLIASLYLSLLIDQLLCSLHFQKSSFMVSKQINFLFVYLFLANRPDS